MLEVQNKEERLLGSSKTRCGTRRAAIEKDTDKIRQSEEGSHIHERYRALRSILIPNNR